MEKKLKTTSNKAVQTFITYGNRNGSRQLKNERLDQLEEVLSEQGIYLAGKVYRVLEKIIYDLTCNGIVKVSREYLSKKLEVGLNTISKAFKYMKQSKLFILSRNQSGKTNNGCRVIVDVQHVNFESILREVYHLNDYEIAIIKVEFKHQNKHQNKHQDSIQNAVILTQNESNQTLNYNNCNNQNKILKDIKTSTKQSSTLKNNLYTQLKDLYIARTGSLEDFKEFSRVIFGSIKKIKAEGNQVLSHMQIETIMYQSLDAAISARDQNVKKNRLALLSAIIQKKIEDFTMLSKLVKGNNAVRNMENVPDWFETRHEEVAELTDQEKLYFAKERERILVKLNVVQ